MCYGYLLLPDPQDTPRPFTIHAIATRYARGINRSLVSNPPVVLRIAGARGLNSQLGQQAAVLHYWSPSTATGFMGAGDSQYQLLTILINISAQLPQCPALVPVGPKPRCFFCWAVIQKKSHSERSHASHILYYIQNRPNLQKQNWKKAHLGV